MSGHRFLAALALVCAPAVLAQPPTGTENAAAAARPADPYSGVVVNNTITFIGHEFYQTFVASWRDEPGVDRFTVAIHERPSARWGSLVFIEYENRELFRAFLSPGRRDYVRQSAADAVRIIYQRVVDLEVQRLLFRDPDLAQDEL
jgi:curli production assembly/transport component CsgE